MCGVQNVNREIPFRSVSIVTPCYNERESIANVIRSYYDEIIAKIEDSEFIVIDDCSRDGSYEILKQLGIEHRMLPPRYDEPTFSDGSVEEHVQQLAQGKAESLMRDFPSAIIIAADQLCV